MPFRNASGAYVAGYLVFFCDILNLANAQRVVIMTTRTNGVPLSDRLSEKSPRPKIYSQKSAPPGGRSNGADFYRLPAGVDFSGLIL